MIGISNIGGAEKSYRQENISLTDCDSCQSLKESIRTLVAQLEENGWTIDSITTEGGFVHLVFYRGPHETKTRSA